MTKESKEEHKQIATAVVIAASYTKSSVKEKKRILIVDDEPDITLSLGIGLEQYGFEVQVFNDAKEALSNFTANYYDLLLFDINMPKMNGFELYKEIEKLDNKVRVCFMTAFELYLDEFKRLFPKFSLSCFANCCTFRHG
jgi:two-component system, OmpR family, response regulator ChvI